jgi:hypothetical protein
MVMFLGFMAAITLVMWLAPDSAAGRVLNKQLVEKPLAALSDLNLKQVIFWAIMANLLAGAAFGGGEAFLLLGPEVVTGIAMDMAIYLDAVIVTYALSALATARKSLHFMTLPITSRLRRLRARRKRTAIRKPERKPSNDDEPHPAFVALAA